MSIQCLIEYLTQLSLFYLHFFLSPFSLAATDKLFFEEHFMRYKCDTCGPGGALGATLNLTDSAVSASLFSLSISVCALSVLFATIWVKCYKTILASKKNTNDTSV